MVTKVGVNTEVGERFLVDLPYRKHLDTERDAANDLARKIGCGDPAIERIWKSTQRAGLEMVERIRNFGYEIDDPKEWGSDPGNEVGSASRIYVNNRVLVGKIAIWEEGGFLSEPVSIYIPGYDKKEKNGRENILSTFRLADRLKRENIPFGLYPSFRDLNLRRQELTNEQLHIMDCLTEYTTRNLNK